MLIGTYNTTTLSKSLLKIIITPKTHLFSPGQKVYFLPDSTIYCKVCCICHWVLQNIKKLTFCLSSYFLLDGNIADIVLIVWLSLQSWQIITVQQISY